MKRATCVVLAVLAVGAGCRRERAVAIIGYARPAAASKAVSVVREELAEHAARGGGSAIRVVFDSLGYGDPPDVELDRATRLTRVSGLVGVVGHSGSRASLVAAPVYNEAGIPQIEPTGTSRLLRHAGPWTLRLAPDDSVEGAFIARFVLERLGARRVSVFYQNDEYGSGIRDGVVASLGARGVPVHFEAPVDGRSDLATLLDASLAGGRPDVVISGARGVETGRLARLLRRRVPGSRLVAGDGALALPQLVEEAGPAADSIYVVSFWLPDAPDSLSQAFVARYRRLVGADPFGGEAMSHDALMLLAHAAAAVGPDRGAIRDYLMSLGVSRPPYQGVTGPIAFVPNRPGPLHMARLMGGTLLRVREDQ